MFDKVTDYHLEEIKLIREKFCMMAPVSPELFHIDILRDEHADEFIVRGMLHLWQQQCERDKVLKVPADWWQHFKQRWFPRWALRKWPVKYMTYEALRMFPQWAPPRSLGESVVRFRRIED